MFGLSATTTVPHDAMTAGTLPHVRLYPRDSSEVIPPSPERQQVLERTLGAAAKLLHRCDIPFHIVGGLACSLVCGNHIRSHDDVDLAVSEAHAEKIPTVSKFGATAITMLAVTHISPSWNLGVGYSFHESDGRLEQERKMRIFLPKRQDTLPFVDLYFYRQTGNEFFISQGRTHLSFPNALLLHNDRFQLDGMSIPIAHPDCLKAVKATGKGRAKDSFDLARLVEKFGPLA